MLFCYNIHMLDITLVAIGPSKDRSLRDLAENYQARLTPYVKLETIELPAQPFSAASRISAQQKEGRAISDYLAKRQASNRPAKVYLLAENGKMYDSVSLSGWLEKESPSILVLGGTLGFAPELAAQYPSLSLSPLTFPHELARLILLEQLYRSACILIGKDYHY